MSAHLTQENIGAYLRAQEARERGELERMGRRLSGAEIGGDAFFQLLGAVIRHREYVEWMRRALADPSAVGIQGLRAEAGEALFDYNPVGMTHAGAFRASAQKTAIRHVYGDLDPDAILIWLIDNDRVECHGQIGPQEIEALESRDANAVLALVVRAWQDGETQLALDLAFALDGSGRIKPGYILTLAQSRAQDLRRA